ncbi:MAG: hypothetical protein UR28_C0003G0064 [Candidatus Peregrinibacteria bacterium GW2011_GWF2_33_10]|nr:MAG: hypothetical protein UR28_C0003G0064 [Candidatus Peregrinibacteria bacterium GW2011_GWF2_33_10]
MADLTQQQLQEIKIMEIFALKTPVLEKNFDFQNVIDSALKKAKLNLESNDLLVIASKIVALNQGRIFKIKSDLEFKKLVKKEADFIDPLTNWLTIKNGIFIANGGIDQSNIPKNQAILWPNKPYEFAEKLCKNLKKKYKIKNLGIIITDSQCTPLRRGVTGIALGYAGFIGVENLIGKKDLFGKILKHTTRNLADSLSSAALVLMGESKESIPMALIKNSLVKFTNKKINPKDVQIPIEEDLFRGVLRIN